VAQCRTLYLPHVEWCISAHPWRFVMHVRQLARVVDAPVAFWPYAYKLPSDRLGVIQAAYTQPDLKRSTRDFDVQGDELLARADAVWVEYFRDVPPAGWPSYFREFVVVSLSSKLAHAVRADEGLSAQLKREAFGAANENGRGGLFGVAVARDAQAAPSRPFLQGDGPLLDARR
jgi:hypothetical protein